MRRVKEKLKPWLLRLGRNISSADSLSGRSKRAVSLTSVLFALSNFIYFRYTAFPGASYIREEGHYRYIKDQNLAGGIKVLERYTSLNTKVVVHTGDECRRCHQDQEILDSIFEEVGRMDLMAAEIYGSSVIQGIPTRVVVSFEEELTESVIKNGVEAFVLNTAASEELGFPTLASVLSNDYGNYTIVYPALMKSRTNRITRGSYSALPHEYEHAVLRFLKPEVFNFPSVLDEALATMFEDEFYGSTDLRKEGRGEIHLQANIVANHVTNNYRQEREKILRNIVRFNSKDLNRIKFSVEDIIQVFDRLVEEEGIEGMVDVGYESSRLLDSLAVDYLSKVEVEGRYRDLSVLTYAALGGYAIFKVLREKDTNMSRREMMGSLGKFALEAAVVVNLLSFPRWIDTLYALKKRT